MKERWEKRIKEINEVVIEKELQNYHHQWKDTKVHGLTKNLSSGGAAILTNTELPINTIFKITLKISSSNKIIKVPALVKWVRPIDGEYSYEVGLEFGHDSPNTIMDLKKHLAGKDSL